MGEAGAYLNMLWVRDRLHPGVAVSPSNTQREKHIHTYRQSKFTLHMFSQWVDGQPKQSHEEVSGDNAAEFYTLIYQYTGRAKHQNQ